MKVLGVITARGGSKRVPRKNLRLLEGKPLVTWMIEAALKAHRIDRLVVSSEDDEILALARTYRPELALERPAELATDTSASVDVVRHAVKALEDRGEGPFTSVVTLQPTTPLTLAEDIDASVEMSEKSSTATVVSVTKLENVPHPAKLKLMDEQGNLTPWLEDERGRMAAHQLPKIYVRNGAIYVTPRVVLEQNKIIGDECRGYLMPTERSVDVNYEIDWQFLEFLLSRKRT